MGSILGSYVLDEIVDILSREYLCEEVYLDDVVIGVFYTGVKLSSGYGGVAFTPRKEIRKATCCVHTNSIMPDAGNITSIPIGDILRLRVDKKPLNRAISIATINALSQKIILENIEEWGVTLDSDPLDVIELKKDDVVTMVGAFPPYIRRLRNVVRDVKVFDTNLRAVIEAGVPINPLSSLPTSLRGSDVVIATGSSFVNNTADMVIENSKNARELVFVGPTASMIPSPLFKRGVTCVGGVLIEDAEKMMRVIAQAGGGKALLGTCARKYSIRRG